MKGGGFIKMRSLLCLAGLLALTLAAGLSPAAGQTPTAPFTLRAKLKVNTVVLTASDPLYTIAVTDTSGNPLTDPTTGSTTYGGVAAGRFEYEIPTYDVSLSAAETTACITVSYNTTPLTMTYPAQGSCPAGSGEITGLVPGYAVGFGGIDGQPNNSSYTFANPITVTSSTAVAPTVNVQCDSSTVNGATPETFSTPVNLGQSAQDTTCQIINTGVKTLGVTSLTTTGCGFSVVTPEPTAAAPISIVSGENAPMTIAFAPCNAGAQTGSLTVKSNDPASPYTVALAGTGSASINLAAGWNLISLPAVPTSTDPGTLLTGLSVEVVCGWSGGLSGQWSCYPTQTGIPTLTNMTIGNGYWIEMNAGGTLTVD